MMLRAEVFSPSGDAISVRIVNRPTLSEAEDELFEWFNAEFTVGCNAAVDIVDDEGEPIEQLHDWCL